MAQAIGPQGQKALAKVAVNSGAMDVATVRIGEVFEWKDNPRKNDAAAPKLAEILKEHGQRTPIVVWRKNMVIYKGNTTFKAAKILGWPTIKVILADFPSEQAATAYGIADNKASEFSDWDDTVLSNLMKAGEGFFTKGNTGFTDRELAALQLATDMPDKLDMAGIAGESEAMGEYLVIQFTEPGDLERFREWMGLGKQERTLLFTDMVKTMGLEW